MLDLNDADDLKAYEELKKAGLSMSGTNFALGMRRDDGKVRVFKRPNQPCQGGEMRKYESTHPGDCTRPNDRRPGDLRMPFPLGTPEAVSVHFNFSGGAEWLEFLTALYGPNSPYQPGTGNPWNVEFLMKNDRAHGMILLDTEVDPTVFVNSLQFLNTMKGPHAVFGKYRAAGFTEAESLLIMMLSNNDPSQMGFFAKTFEYYFPTNASIRRILEGKPHDLSGGTLRDRFDYNRPQVQSLFAAGKGEVRTIFRKAMEDKGHVFEKTVEIKSPYGSRPYQSVEYQKFPFDELCAMARIVIDEAVEASKDEDYSVITLENKNFGKSGKESTSYDYGVADVEIEPDYDDDEYNDDDDYNQVDWGPVDDTGLVKGEWYDKGLGMLFEYGCDCISCKKGQKKYFASLVKEVKEPKITSKIEETAEHKVIAVETTTLTIAGGDYYDYVASGTQGIAPGEVFTTKAGGKISFVQTLKAAPKSPKGDAQKNAKKVGKKAA